MGVPYYAGSRVVVYNKDLFKKAGVKGTPTSLAKLVADGKKLMKANSSDKGFSAFYVAGKDWYSALAFVYDYGGQIATSSGGKWTGTLDQPRAIAGLNAFKSTFLALSKASKSTDEANPFPTTPFSQGKAASFVGPGWQFGYALDPKAGNPKLKPFMAAYAMPSHTPGKTMPAFLGGSDLAIPAQSQNIELAQDWIARLHGERPDVRDRQGGEPPQHDVAPPPRQGQRRARRSRKSAKVTWFVPTAKNWTNVESANVLRTDADEHPHRQGDRAAGGEVGEPKHHLDPQRRHLSMRRGEIE